MKLEVGHKYNLFVSHAETEYTMDIISLDGKRFVIDFCVTSLGNGTVKSITLGEKFTSTYSHSRLEELSKDGWVITKHIEPVMLDEDLFTL